MSQKLARPWRKGDRFRHQDDELTHGQSAHARECQMRLPPLDTQYAFLPFSFLKSLIPTIFSILCTNRQPKHNSILNSRADDQRRIIQTSEKLAKSLAGPLVKLSNLLPGDDKRQTNYYSDRKNTIQRQFADTAAGMWYGLRWYDYDDWWTRAAN